MAASEVILIVAGGSGRRMGADFPKQFIPVAGKPIIIHTIERFWEYNPEIAIMVVIPKESEKEWIKISSEFINKEQELQLQYCYGGASRMDSVANGLEEIAKSIPSSAKKVYVAIHDAVRPFLSSSVIEIAFSTAKKAGNAVVCVPVKSSMRMKTDNGSKAVDRSAYYHVQTPQIFDFMTIQQCYREVQSTGFTDDASLAEHFGIDIHLSTGSYDNIKITTPEDLLIAGELAKKYFLNQER